MGLMEFGGQVLSRNALATLKISSDNIDAYMYESRSPRVATVWARQVVRAARYPNVGIPGAVEVQILAVRLAGNPAVPPALLTTLAHDHGVISRHSGLDPVGGPGGNYYLELSQNPSSPRAVIDGIYQALMRNDVTSGYPATVKGIMFHQECLAEWREDLRDIVLDNLAAGRRLGDWLPVAYSFAGYFPEYVTKELQSQILVAAASS